jgi:ABC-type transport system substrate-binding protein
MTLKRRAIAGLAASAAGALALTACGGGGSDDGSASITWAVDSGWESWNSYTSEGNNSYLNQALSPSQPTIDFDPNGEAFYPEELYAGPPELVSESPLTVKYTLNPNAQWNDGEPVRVEDMIFTWHSTSGLPEHCDVDVCAPASTDWGANVESIEETGENEITLTYKEGYVNPEWSFRGLDGEAGFLVASHVVEEAGFAEWMEDPAVMAEASKWLTENLPTWSVGPYVPVDGKPGDFIRYEPNENYQGDNEPALDELTIKVVEGGIENVVTELRQGEIDGVWVTTYTSEDLAPLEEDEALGYDEYTGSVWAHIDFNTQVVTDVPLREAIFTAINREDLIERVYPDQDVSVKNNHIFRSDSEYYQDIVGETTQGTGDPAAARAILEEAGYTWNGDDKLVDPEGEVVTLTFSYSQNNTIRKQVAELTQAYVAEIGIDLEITPFPDEELGNVLASADFEMISYGWSGNPAFTVAPQQYWKSDSDSNYGKFTVEGLDETLAQVTATNDLATAAEAANAATQTVVENAYVLPLWDSPVATLYNTKVDGLEPNGNTQAGALWNVAEWSVAE